MTTKETVLAIKKEFPGFDRVLLSKGSNPPKYGIQLVTRAKVLGGINPPRKHEKAGCPYKLTIRTTKELYESIQVIRTSHGHKYISDTIIFLIEKGIQANVQI